jgi:hypothetical protein
MAENKTSSAAHESPSLTNAVKQTLVGLIKNPYPTVPNPEGCKKRASVSLILRIRPHYDHWPESCIARDEDEPEEKFVERFFAQQWVQMGDAEVVFIKRASRVGDRWTSRSQPFSFFIFFLDFLENSSPRNLILTGYCS